MSQPSLKLTIDRALTADCAIEKDKLGRRPFAQLAVNALRVGESAGFVISIEGPWGSGKSSTFALIEALLRQDDSRSVIVHFNPWQIGDRDALLRVFLTKMATQLELADNVGNAQKAAQQLKAYTKVFDLLKLIPGAGELAQAVGSVVGSAGDAIEAAANLKAADLEARKNDVAIALRELERPIVVFIDDIDRLFPQEVFEMVRIVKAVGDLPNVRYVLAWDQEYVAEALRAVSVPRSESYLDKIVQVRLPLPAITKQARVALIDEAIEGLPLEARDHHFPNDQQRLSKIYFGGLREMLEHPRGFERVFSTVALIEPALRGEVVLADIIGLATLMVKCGPVYEMLKREPSAFIGRMPTDELQIRKAADVVKEAVERRRIVTAACPRPTATTRLVHTLFPMTAEADGANSYGQVADVEGHIAAPSRLVIALQLQVSGSDVSVVLAKRYMLQKDKRESVIATLNGENCVDFIETMGDIASSTAVPAGEVEDLCVDIANLLEREPFCARGRGTGRLFSVAPSTVAVRAIENIVQSSSPAHTGEVAQRLVANPNALTVAVDVYLSSFMYERSHGDRVLAPQSSKAAMTGVLSANIVAAARTGAIYALCNPGRVLWSLSLFNPDAARAAFEATKAEDPTLDRFVTTILGHTTDSTNGLRFEIPEEASRIDAYVAMSDLEAHATTRLADPLVALPASAAWRAVIDKAAYYAVDGSKADGRR